MIRCSSLTVGRANLRVLGVDEVKSVPYAPVSHPFFERLIGTIRREFLDHVLIWSVLDLEKKLGEFQRYFNDARVHASLGATPKEVAGESARTSARLDDFRWRAHCRGPVKLPIAACAVIRDPQVRRKSDLSDTRSIARMRGPQAHPALVVAGIDARSACREQRLRQLALSNY